MSLWSLVQVAVPWLWVGAVLAISFLEAPLKFRAPGITVPLGVGIGRLVFRALNRVEAVLALLLTVAVALGDARTATIWILLVLAWLLLAGKALVLRPLMDRRARQRLEDDTRPSPLPHLAYIALEVLTVLSLAAIGTLSLDQLLP